MTVRMFFYAQRKSGFEPPRTAAHIRPATIKGTLWVDGDDGYLKVYGAGTVHGEVMDVENHECDEITKEEKGYGWWPVKVQIQETGESAWAFEYDGMPPLDAVKAEQWPADPNALHKSVAKPAQEPRTDGETVETIEAKTTDLKWNERSPSERLAKSTGKLKEMIRQIRARRLQKDTVGLIQERKAKHWDNVDEFPNHTQRTTSQVQEPEGPLVKALKPEGSREEAHQTSRERKGNKDLNAKQPDGEPIEKKGKATTPGHLAKSRPIDVSVVAVICGDHILMGRRRITGKLTMPGGHADEGEFPEQTARRELWEETGINAKELKYIGYEDVLCRDGRTRRINCFITFGNFVPTNRNDPDQEISEWLWVPAVKYTPQGVSDELAEEISEELHDMRYNVMLELLGIKYKRG